MRDSSAIRTFEVRTYRCAVGYAGKKRDRVKEVAIAISRVDYVRGSFEHECAVQCRQRNGNSPVTSREVQRLRSAERLLTAFDPQYFFAPESGSWPLVICHHQVYDITIAAKSIRVSS